MKYTGNEDRVAHFKHATNGRTSGWHSLLWEENTSYIKAYWNFCGHPLTYIVSRRNGSIPPVCFNIHIELTWAEMPQTVCLQLLDVLGIGEPKWL